MGIDLSIVIKTERVDINVNLLLYKQNFKSLNSCINIDTLKEITWWVSWRDK